MSLRHYSVIALVCSLLLGIAPAQAGDCSNEATFKSAPGGTATDIFFHNGSAQQRRVYWLDENGQRKLKSIVEAGQTQRQSTIAGHAWVVTDGNEACLYVIVASSAPITAEIGEGQGGAPAQPQAQATPQAPPQAQAAATTPPPTAAAPATGSTVARLGLSGWYQLMPVAQPGRVLNNMENGRPEVENVKNEWESAYWQFSDLPEGYVAITNKWTQKNLATRGQGVTTIVGAERGSGAQWTLESVDNGAHVVLKSRFTNRYLSATSGGFEFIEQPGAANAGLWQLVRSTQPQAVEERKAPSRKPVVVETERAPPKKSRTCPKGERFDRERLDCVSIGCGRHQVWSKSEGQCISKASTCGKNEVYSSSVAACIPKEQPPKVKPQTPKVPKCAYKMDGVGNCLTPAFRACQNAYGACMKACGKNAGKCEANCHTKFASQCGD